MDAIAEMDGTMAQLIPGVRNAVRAVIVRDQRLLIQHKVYASGEHRYVLPGGAPDEGETLIEGLQRECEEEIGTRVRVDDLLHVADYFKLRETDPPTRRHQVEFLFRCHLPDSYEPGNGPKPDKHQFEVIWMSFNDAPTSPLFPPGLKEILTAERPTQGVYLGLID